MASFWKELGIEDTQIPTENKNNFWQEIGIPEESVKMETQKTYPKFSEDALKEKLVQPAAAVKGLGKYFTKLPGNIARLVPLLVRQLTPYEAPFRPFIEEKTEKALSTQTPLEQASLKRLEDVLPSSEKTKIAEEYGERIGPYLQSSNPLIGLLMGATGQLAKEKGVGELGQLGIELGTGLGLGAGQALIQKGIGVKSAQKETYNFAKKMGMSDKEIALLMQSKRKIKYLSQLADKGTKTHEALKSTKGFLDSIYDSIAGSKIAKKELTPDQAMKFAQSVKNKMKGLPVEVRERLQKDAFELAKNGFKGSELINFWSDINYHYSRGYQQLGILKGPIGEAIKDISPSLYKDFENTNKLFESYYKISGALKPKVADNLIKAGKTYGIVKSIFTFNLKNLAAIGGFTAAQKMARELLINPKYTNLTSKLIKSLNDNNLKNANMIFQKLLPAIKKASPEIYDEIKDADFNDLSVSK